MLVVIEGPDGIGKTVVATMVAEAMDADVIHFPNDDSVTGPLIRDYLRKRWSIAPTSDNNALAYDRNGLASALAFQCLQVVNRLEVMPRLATASSNDAEAPRLVCVRYWQSGWVYGQMDGLDSDFLVDIHSELVQPHLSILLDASAEVCMSRIALRNKAADRYETSIETTRRVVDLYRELWWSHRAEKSWSTVDATKTVDQVVADIIEICYSLP